MEKTKDISLKLFSESENCYHHKILSVLGSNESVTNISACCNICTRGKVDSTRLNVLVPTSQKRTRKPKPMQHITNSIHDFLKNALMRERDKILDENIG